MAVHIEPRQAAADRRQKRPLARPAVYAALDLGTNNCRLLIARPEQSGFRVVDAFSRIVRLGEGMGATGCLTDAAMERTLDALKVCAEKMARGGVTAARNVATEACRRARNGRVFLDQVQAQTGIRFEIIGSEEEAQLAVSGCASLLCVDRPNAVVLDIGGGSTELIWLDVDTCGRPSMRGFLSLPFGVVNFAERYGRDRVSDGDYDAMVAEVTRALAPFSERHGIAASIDQDRVQMLGTSGTVTTLTGVLLGLKRYDRRRVDGAYLRFDDIFQISRDLRGMSYEDRAAHPCICHERADLVVAGAAILEGICRMWPVGRLRVADRSLREGILLDLMADPDAAGG